MKKQQKKILQGVVKGLEVTEDAERGHSPELTQLLKGPRFDP